MGKSKKGKEEKFIPVEKIVQGLNNIESQLASASSVENLEKIKLALIKLFNHMKNKSNVENLNEKRIELLKECNLNIQFLNRDDDIWTLFKQHHVQQAYDNSILTLKVMNEHPQRYLIKTWVRNISVQTMTKIADLATSHPAEQDRRKRLKMKVQRAQQPQLEENQNTILNPEESTGNTSKAFPSPSFQVAPSPTQNTFRPQNSENSLNPFGDHERPFPPS